MSGLTLDEMNRRIATRDAERDCPRAVTAALVRMKIRRKRSPPAQFCSLCTVDIPRPHNAPPDWTPRQEPLGRNDALVSVCEPCATGPIVERDHLFGGGSGIGHDGHDGVGEGGRRRGTAGRGGR